MSFKQIIPSIKKELWENGRGVLWLPLVLVGLMILAVIFFWIEAESVQVAGIIDGVKARLNNKQSLDIDLIILVFMPILFFSFFVQLHYLLVCLFDERRDKSIYFWRSLPVPDGLTVGVKLLVGSILIPSIFMAIAAVFSIMLMLIILTIAAVGYDVSFGDAWAQSYIISKILYLWWSLFLSALWLFPVYAWLMLASSFAKKSPFLWAVLPVVILFMIEAFVVEFLGIHSNVFFVTIRDYFTFGMGQGDDSITHFSINNKTEIQQLPSILLNKLSVMATLLGCALMYITYWLRVNRSQE